MGKLDRKGEGRWLAARGEGAYLLGARISTFVLLNCCRNFTFSTYPPRFFSLYIRLYNCFLFEIIFSLLKNFKSGLYKVRNHIFPLFFSVLLCISAALNCVNRPQSTLTCHSSCCFSDFSPQPYTLTQFRRKAILVMIWRFGKSSDVTVTHQNRAVFCPTPFQTNFLRVAISVYKNNCRLNQVNSYSVSRMSISDIGFNF